MLLARRSPAPRFMTSSSEVIPSSCICLPSGTCIRNINIAELKHRVLEANSGFRMGPIWVHFGSNWRAEIEREDNDKSRSYNGLGLGDYSPEKAGVGGSIPSLATMFSITCKPLKTDFTSQNVPKLYCSLVVGTGSFSTARLRDSGMS